MFGRSRFVYFAAFLALLAPALADTVYRFDDRSPQEIYDAGGFVAWNPDGDGSILDHGLHKLGEDDPWVSTSTDYDFLKSGAVTNSEVYIYYIATAGVEFVDVIKAFEDADEEPPYPAEKEMAVKSKIDWESITKWDVIDKNGEVTTVERDDWEDDNLKRSVPLVRSVKFRA